ncbi:hypothetical protein M0R45_015525 [Rubus argutus]|uniref:Uncharacterized protein n=1 Tax=Rubus argutus TaxID=59490 RepID=A0AAW1XSC1_RUBAR
MASGGRSRWYDGEQRRIEDRNGVRSTAAQANRQQQFTVVGTVPPSSSPHCLCLLKSNRGEVSAVVDNESDAEGGGSGDCWCFGSRWRGRSQGEDKRRETLERSDKAKVLIGGSREWRWVEIEEHIRRDESGNGYKNFSAMLEEQISLQYVGRMSGEE